MSVPTPSVSGKRQVQQALSRWKGSIAEHDLPLFRAFVEDTLTRLRGPFLAHHPPVVALQHFEIAFQFARRRANADISVTVRPGVQKGALVLSCMADQSFIVDTGRLFLKRNQAEYWGGFNLVFDAVRNADGELTAVGAGGQPESLVLMECDAGSLLDDTTASASALHLQLALAHAMVDDFKVMTAAAEDAAARCEATADEDCQETAAFLSWLLLENFVFMGANVAGRHLGFQKVAGPYATDAGGAWPAAHRPGRVQVRKSWLESPVHRAGRLDEILVQLPDGSPMYLCGLFTYRAVTAPTRNVPVLRQVLSAIQNQSGAQPGSFRYKGLANVFDSLPTEFLFTVSEQAIFEIADLVFEGEQRQEVGVAFLETAPTAAFCLVAMPKAQYREELRRELEEIVVATTQASSVEHGVFVGRYETVLLHFYLAGVSLPDGERTQRMTDEIRHRATPWISRLWHDLSAQHGEAEADRLIAAYGRSFPESWMQQTPPERAVVDIGNLEALTAARPLLADLHVDRKGALQLSLYQGTDVYLTDILPVLDNFGLTVADSFAVPVKSEPTRHIDTFRILGAKDVARDAILARRDALVAAIEASFAGQIEGDRLNQLVLSGGLSWQEVDVLRGLCRYARQLQIKLPIARTFEILLARPTLGRDLVQLFHARFDPDLAGERNAAVAEAAARVEAAIRALKGYDEDLLVRALFGLITAMIRTNFYRTDRKFHYLSFKFDCSRIDLMGARRPKFEIYVHHKLVEGVHLRFGKVARGGIRWSDRDDFRTEVLGLATTQQVKNVVIVPEGSKGGFYLKYPSRDPGVRRQEADNLYRTFISGLLDLTDNSRDGKIVPPPRVVRWDADDPYLVVAADKGTAHLSDTANQLSLAYGHWLGDAFASGGSNGYDHKKVGITARGGWVLVKRHFAELGKDAYAEPFTCVGIGDMSGDVFGNGLIETPWTKLLAAFNHVHIFLDPTPDPAATFDERLRLFKAERKGGWENYNTALISEGGGVFERSAKSIPLSSQVQAMLGLHQAEAAPDTVIAAILKMDVDLLWNGGIGTYIKASSETHADADDRANDAVRADARDLRCKIIGEGGNLGCTQQARIEAGLLGIRLNTDAIDNSGGVDLSDHEVNLKILLDRVVARGDLTLDARNALLEQMTSEVADLVLADNDAHGRQLSRDELRSKYDIFSFGRAIDFIEREMGQNRKALRLPAEGEIERRASLGVGLTRPELAVLSAWAKMYVFRELLADKPKLIPGYDALLTTYFPGTILQRFPDDIRNHMLANEIVCTVATTRVVADAGAAFFPLLVESTGRSVREIATAYLKAQAALGVEGLRADFEVLRPKGTHALYQAWNRLDQAIREVCAQWLSARGAIPADDQLGKLGETAAIVFRRQPSDLAAHEAKRVQQMVEAGVSADVARRVREANHVPVAMIVDEMARRAGTSVDAMVVRYLAVARASGLDAVLVDLSKRPATGRWDPVALGILYGRFQAQLRSLVDKTSVSGGSVEDLASQLATGALADVRGQTAAAGATPSVAALVVLEERLEGLLARRG
jgi:glutamate dehydrogenase